MTNLQTRPAEAMYQIYRHVRSMHNDPRETIMLVRSKERVMIFYGISRPVNVRAVLRGLAVIVPTRVFLAMISQARDLGCEGDDCLIRGTVYESVVNECYPLKILRVHGTP